MAKMQKRIRTLEAAECQPRRTKEKSHEKGVSEACEQIWNVRFHDAKRLVEPCEGENPKEQR